MAPPGFEIRPDAAGARAYLARFFRPWVSDTQVGLLLIKHDKPVAAALYDHFNGSDVWIQIAGTPGQPWLTRAAIGWAFKYPFEQLGCKRITARISSENSASLRFAKRMGFKVEGEHPNAGIKGETMVTLGLLKKDCRYVAP